MCNAMRYTEFVIVSFQHKGLEGFYVSGSKKGIRPDHATKLARILSVLDVAAGPQDLALPSFHTHPMTGDFAGYWSVSVNGNWRVIFQFTGTDVELVDYRDYH